MRILVFGASGMLGHKLVQVLGGEFETVAAVRRPGALPTATGAADVIGGFEASDPNSVVGVLDRVKPDAVVNAVGLVKQLMHDDAHSDAIAVNALFPNVLAEHCTARRLRLVHYSTDCVFSGARDSRRGPRGYRESDPSDCNDLYGLSKRLGEPEGGGALILRTSIIGRELRGRAGLVEWFLSQTGAVRGFTNALFSGLTTLELARLTMRLLRHHASLSGLWHVAGDPISKHDLLGLVKQAYGLSTPIHPHDDVYCDRRLDGSRFEQATKWHPPDWSTMIAEMRQDPHPCEGAGADRQFDLARG